MNGRRQGWAIAVALLMLGALVLWLARGEWSDHVLPTAPATGEREAPALPVFATDEPVVPAEVAVPPVAAEETRAAPASGATRLVVHVTWSDATPAADVHLKALFWDQPDPLHHRVPGATDASGTWIREPAPLGQVTVYSDRSDSVSGEVEAGRTTELRLALAAGTLVRGLVVYEDDRPAPGAEIWLSDYGNHTEGASVARSGHDGRFELRDVLPWRYIGAQAEGHVPSPLATLENEAPPAMDVRLQLGGAGATVRGLVVGPDGAPIPGAYVLAGPEGGWPGPDRHRAGAGPPPLQLETAADGAFLAADMPPGTIPFGVKATGWTPWTGWTKVAAGETKDLRIELKPSSWIEGIVRDGNGEVVADASIHTGSYGQVNWVETKSDAAGHYVLRDLPQQEEPIVASKKGVGEEKRTFAVFPGRAYTWDPVLTLGLQIFGHVIDESGAPVEGLHVQASHKRADGWRRQSKVAADGAFVLPNCDDVENIVEVLEADWKEPALVSLVGIRPGPEELRIVLPADARLFATVTGRVVDEAGLPPAGLSVALMPVGRPFGDSGSVDEARGEFTFDKLRAGDYRAHVRADNRASLILPVAGVRAGERRDLGTLVLQAPGVVVVRFLLAPGLEPKRVDCTLQAADGMFGTASMKGHEEGLLERRSEPMPPGEWVVRATGTYAIPVQVPVRVEAGRETRVDVALEKGVRQHLWFVMPYAETHRIEVWVSDASGAVVEHGTHDASPFPDRNESRGILVFVLRPGHYALRVTLDGKDSLQTGLDVPAGVDDGPKLEFTLP